MARTVVNPRQIWATSANLPLTIFLREFLRLLSIREGVVLEGYKDFKGLLTIGIGHLVQRGEPYQLGKQISFAECMKLFHYDMERLKITQFATEGAWWGIPQQLAVASFLWSHGYGKWKGETRALCLNPATTQDQLQKWVRSNWDLNSPQNKERNRGDFELFHPKISKKGMVYHSSTTSSGTYVYIPSLKRSFPSNNEFEASTNDSPSLPAFDTSNLKKKLLWGLFYRS
jgi:GH24 family phage-related lysozyme (muramidase)